MRSFPFVPVTESVVIAALRDCYHPELRANVVDLGLVYSIEVVCDPNAAGSGIPGVPWRFRVEIVLLQANFAHDTDDSHAQIDLQIAALIKNRMAAFPNVSRTEVHTIHDPAWTADSIAPELRERVRLALASNHRSHDLVQIQTPSKASR